MTTTIAISNQKGGVGKTTTSVNLAAGLAARGFRTLLVDLDSQRNASNTLLTPDKITRTLADVLVGEGSRVLLEDAIYETEIDKLDIVPSDIRLARIERFIDLEEQFRLKDALTTVEPSYDFILLDCPPTLGMTLTQALLAARWVLVPIAADYYSHEGVNDLLESLQKARRGNKSLDVLGYLVTRYDGRKRVAQQSLKLTQDKFGDLAFSAIVRELAAIMSAPALRLTVYEFEPASAGAADYTAVTEEVLARVKRKSATSKLHVVSSKESAA